MKRIYVTVAILAITLVTALIWWHRGVTPVDSKNNTPKIFVVEPGQGVRAIAKNLKDQGLIKDPIVFFLLTKQLRLDSKIQAGTFRLLPSMSANQIANELTHGTLDIWITIPEGQRAQEIADTLEKSMPNFDPSWRDVLEENEGYLFPDTYLLPKESEIDTIVTILTNNFNQKFDAIDTTNTNLSREEIVTLASLIEREARLDEDRPIVSSVIHNRLDIGMKLDIDATLQYILGYQVDEKRWWKMGLTNEDKTLNSPYNTYQVAGLPPGPIANPGIESLRAAVSPANTDFLYYITDSSGKNRYGKTLADHEANIERYGL